MGGSTSGLTLIPTRKLPTHSQKSPRQKSPGPRPANLECIILSTLFTELLRSPGQTSFVFLRYAPILSKISPPAFFQKLPSCCWCHRSAITTFFSNKNAFKAILEPCFKDGFPKNSTREASLWTELFHVEQFLLNNKRRPTVRNDHIEPPIDTGYSQALQRIPL